MERERLIRKALKVWAPSWPRRVTRNQRWAYDEDHAVAALLDSEANSGNSPFVSTYAFPRGHSKENNIPQVDTLFVDFDFEGGDYKPGSGDVDAWRRDISHLLVRVRKVAQYIQDAGRPGWRASLSGHKGVHLYLDFPPIDDSIGDLYQFIHGMSDYADELVDHLSSETGISDLRNYVDVTSSDMGRLCRVPNTLHGGATASFGTERYCVPITIEELAQLTLDDYITYTSEPRELPWRSRNENNAVREHITQRIKNAAPQESPVSRGADFDSSRIDTYRRTSNDSIDLEDIEFLTSDRPCVWRFHQRDDKFQYGNQSHHFELFCIREMMEHNVPIDVMKEFFANVDEYDEQETEWRIKQMIGRDYNRFSIETNIAKSPEFCGYDDCSLCLKVKNNV